jgi:zinc protease
LTKLQIEGPTPDELQKAKNQSISAYYRSLQSIAGRAQVIGQQQVIFGDYHRLSKVEDQINAVTAADIQRVIKTYLQPTNRTVAILVPTAATGDSPRGRRGGGGGAPPAEPSPDDQK